MKNRTLAALMVIALAAGFALAQPGPGAAAPAPAANTRAPMARGMRGMQGMQGMMSESAIPDLTPDQLDKMDALRTAQLKVMLPLRTDLQVKEIGDIREKMEVARINHMFDCRKLMTPEQLKAMKKMGMGRGMMGRGMGRGMRGMMGGCPMGGEGRGMMGENQSDDPPGSMMGQGGQQGCPCGDMH